MKTLKKILLLTAVILIAPNVYASALKKYEAAEKVEASRIKNGIDLLLEVVAQNPIIMEGNKSTINSLFHDEYAKIPKKNVKLSFNDLRKKIETKIKNYKAIINLLENTITEKIDLYESHLKKEYGINNEPIDEKPILDYHQLKKNK